MEAAQYFGFGGMETFLPLYLIGLGYAAWEIGPLFTAQVLVTALTKPALGASPTGGAASASSARGWCRRPRCWSLPCP